MIRKSNKTKYIIYIVLALIVILAVIGIMMNNNSQKDNATNDIAVMQNIELSASNIVLDYNVFYTLENITKQVIESIKQGEYEEIYKLMVDVDKDEMNDIFDEYKEAMNVENNGVKYLRKASMIKENIYVCEFEVQGYTQNMTIRLNPNNTYNILELNKWGYVDD